MPSMLKVIKEVTESGFKLIVGGAAGVVAAVGYLVLNGFKCLTDNINPVITVDASKLNLTEIYNDILHHKGKFPLPIGFALDDDNLAPCVDPLKWGLGAGLLLTGGALTVHYANKYAKHRNRSQKEEVGYQSVNQDIETVKKRSRCC